MEKDKKLNLMRFWIFGIFIIVVAAATIYVGWVAGTGTAIFREVRYWIAIVASALICALVYFGYKAYLNRK